MIDEERIYSVLVVSSSEKFYKTIKDLLPESRYYPVALSHDVASAKRTLLDRSYDIVIINTPLPDDFGVRLGIDICKESGSGVLLFVKAEHYNDVAVKSAPFGVMVISKPTSPLIIEQSLFLVASTRERLRKLEKKTQTIEEKMEEIRIVNRAKWVLIEQLQMTETDAHRYIEKQAMDRCVTRRTIAEEIIGTYK